MLTTRERVLRWHRRGWGAYRIAKKIGVYPQTVYYHLRQLEADGEITDGVRRYRPRRRKS
jgi:predicted transcriptional regulator